MDINKTTHSGTAVSNPTFSFLNNTTPIAIFTLKVREHWLDKNNVKQHRDNVFKVETLGKNAHWVKANVKAGKRFVVDGYLRHDAINGQEEVKIRVFNITFDSNEEHEEGKRQGLYEGLEQALKILQHSDDLISAKSKLEVILKG